MDTEIFKKFNSIAVNKFRPLQASLELTNRCNERCTHCYIDDFRDDANRVLQLEDWFKILDELRNAGSLYLILMGGEPLLSPYFFSIAKQASSLGFHVSMISNGLKIKDLDYAKKLVDNGLVAATFSLYSLDPQIHDKMTRVRGSHEKLMRAIDLCTEAGLTLHFNSLLTEANAPGIFDLYQWSVDRGSELKVDPNVTAKFSGNLDPTKYRASKETLLWFFRKRSELYPASAPKPLQFAKDDFMCNAAKGKCAVTAYGELLPCIEIREPLGNLVESSFADIWHSPLGDKWRQPRFSDLEEDPNDPKFSFCDHCPGMAKNEHKNPWTHTSYTKVIAEAKKQVYMERLNQ